MTAPAPLAAKDVLAGAQTAYTPATLGDVTCIHAETGMGGLSFRTPDGEHKVLLPASDLQTLSSLLGQFLEDHRKRLNSQSFRLSEGSRSDVTKPDEVLK